MGASVAKSRKRNPSKRALLQGEVVGTTHRQAASLKRSNTPDDLWAIASTPSPESLALPLPSTEELAAVSSSEDEITSSDELSESRASKNANAFRRSPSLRDAIEERKLSLVKEVDVAKYMADRQMTKIQEHWNAYTMIPSPLFCLYYILSGRWVPPYQDAAFDKDYDMAVQDPAAACFSPSLFHSMPSLPPSPVIMIAAAIILHAPFSFIYHYKYAHRLRNPIERTAHLSRRLDHTMIHVASALMSYSTSGSWQYFFITCLFNAECVYRHLAIRHVRPRSNQIRILVSMLAYTMPIWKQGQQPTVFLQVWMCFLVSGWFFLAYPIGGWSHSVFHLVVALAIPILMAYAVTIRYYSSQSSSTATSRLVQQSMKRLLWAQIGIPLAESI
jgi:hypothetical protein